MATKKFPRLYRTVRAEMVPLESRARREAGDGAEEEETFRSAISSEAEVERIDWWTGKRYIEILSHAPEAIDMRRFDAGGISLLDSHIAREVRGLITNPAVGTDRVLRGDVRFRSTQAAQELKRDMAGGTMPYLSIGYDPVSARLRETREGGIEVWEVTRWQPMECSSVGVPADFKVGVGRAAGSATQRAAEVAEQAVCEVEIEGPEIPVPATRGGESVHEEGTMAVKPQALAQARTETAAQATATAEAVGAAETRTNGGTASVQVASQEPAAAQIVRMTQAHGMAERAADWIAQGLTPDQVASQILNARRSTTQPTPAAERLENVPDRDLSRYSYRQAILSAVEARETGRFSGLEGELHQELSRFLPANYRSRNGIIVPMRLRDPLAKRATDTKTAGHGMELVADQPGEMIELLRARTYVALMGSRLMTDLKGPVPFSRQLTGLTFNWVSENPGADVTASEPTWGTVTLAPKTGSGRYAFSRQQLHMATIDMEIFAREELAQAHAAGLDRACLHGTGADGQPTGIYLAADVQPKAMGGIPSFEKLVEMVGLIGDSNAGIGGIGWMTTPLMAAKLMCILEAQASGAKMIWTGTLEDGRIAGYVARATNQVSKTLGPDANEHGLIGADWTQGVIGTWAGIELVVDPYTLKNRGLIEVTSFQMMDFILRHPSSFVKATGATIS